jgi:hypothetical protein
MTDIAVGSDAAVVVRQRDASDLAYSAVPERIGARLAALPAVRDVSGVIFSPR